MSYETIKQEYEKWKSHELNKTGGKEVRNLGSGNGATRISKMEKARSVDACEYLVGKFCRKGRTCQ